MRILVVEDEDSIAEPLVNGLRREGFDVVRAATGGAALEAAVPDLVLLDLRLPDIDGLDVCRRMRERSDVPIIVVTARGEEADRVVGLELGADDYVVKPFGLRELIARIRAVTRRTSERTHTHGAASRRRSRDRRARPPRAARRQRARADAEGVRPARRARARPRRRGQPPPAARGGLGDDVVRLGEDDRRPRRVAPPQARRPRVDRDRARGRLPPPRSVTRRLLLGYLGVTLFVLVALEVPLGVQNARTERRDLVAKVAHDATALASLAEDAVQSKSPQAARRRRKGLVRLLAADGRPRRDRRQARLRPRRHEQTRLRHGELRVAARDQGGAPGQLSERRPQVGDAQHAAALRGGADRVRRTRARRGAHHLSDVHRRRAHPPLLARCSRRSARPCSSPPGWSD